MKLNLKHFILSLLIIFISSSNLQLTQLNYREQYDSCINDYQKMYKMMNDKLKFYSENENSLLESVKSTILKTYEKSEKSTGILKKRIHELEQAITNKNVQLNSKLNEVQTLKETYEAKLTKMNNQLIIMHNTNEQLSTSHKVLKNDLKNNKKYDEELKEQLKEYKIIINKQESEFHMKINLLSQKLKELNEKKQEVIYIPIQKNITHKEVEVKLVQVKTQTNQNLNNNIVRGQKLKENLELIKSQLSIFSGNSTNSTSEIAVDSSKDTNEDDVEEFTRKSFFKKLNQTKMLKNNKNLKFFDKTKVNRFLEVQEETFNMNNIEEHVEYLNDKESKLKNILDLVLFDDINMTRQIYKEIQELKSNHNSVLESKEICELNLQKNKKENLELKEALAELETLYRLSKSK